MNLAFSDNNLLQICVCMLLICMHLYCWDLDVPAYIFDILITSMLFEVQTSAAVHRAMEIPLRLALRPPLAVESFGAICIMPDVGV